MMKNSRIIWFGWIAGLLLCTGLAVAQGPARGETLPGPLDLEPLLVEGHRIALPPSADEDSTLAVDPVAYLNLDDDRNYEVVLLAEVPDANPKEIPSEVSWLYLFKRVGEGSRYERMLLQDCGSGRFENLAFPDFDNDGSPEILVTLTSKFAPDFDRFFVLARGGFYYRPVFERERKVWLLCDLDGDERPDIVTTHRFLGEEFLLSRGHGFEAVPFAAFGTGLRERNLEMYQKIVNRKAEREKREKEKADPDDLTPEPEP